MEPRIQYAKTEDGVSIAYATQGEGPPLLLVPSAWEQTSMAWQMPEWRAFLEQLGRGRRLVMYDRRGFGLSERDVNEFSLETEIADLDAVLRALKLRRVAMFASTLAGPPAIGFAVRRKRAVSRLILYGTFSAPSDVMTGKQVNALAELGRSDWNMAARVHADSSSREEFSDAGLAIAEHWKASATGETVAKFLTSGFSVAEMLPQVTTPVLVIHRRDDGVMPMSAGQKLASNIPNAQFAPVEGSVHAYFLGETEPILAAIDSFLGEGEETQTPAAAPTGLVTILFTDMASSTALTRRLGDAKAQEVRRSHNDIVRAALAANGGSEIKHTGDGIMASFPTASSAIESAIAIQRGVEAHKQAHPDSPLAVYIGLNAGEPIAEERDLYGTSVDLAARMCEHAEPGQILASNVVRELAEGKGFLFSDIGEVVPKGFESPVRLYEVRWREQS